MPDGYPRVENLSNKRFSEVISDGLRLFGKSWETLIVPLGLFLLISLIIKNLLVTDMVWQSLLLTPAIEVILDMDPSTLTEEHLNLMMEYLSLSLISGFINSFVITIFNVLAMCLVSNYLYNKFIGNETKFFSEFKKAINGKLISAILLLGVGISVGSLFLFIPSIIIIGLFSFYVFTYNSDDSNQPLKDAREIARGSFWKIIGVFVVSSLIISIISLLFQLFIGDFFVQFYQTSWYNPSTRNYVMIILYDFLYYIVELIFAPLFICLLTSLYVSLKARKEVFGQYQTSYDQTPQSYGTPYRDESSSIKSMNAADKLESGLYCPFCGKFVKDKIKFCPHCGEQFNFEI
jgi:ribosomal protein L33